MSKHTPGPWHCQFKTDKTNNLGVYDADGYLLASLDVHQLAHRGVIQRRLADGRRMAAAPELFDFAREFLADYESEGGMLSMKHYAEKARAAIRKAEGEA